MLTNMKLKPPPKEAGPDCCTLASDGRPEYPWGLRLNLGNEELDKLGLAKMPALGTVLTISAQVEVVSVSEYEALRNGKDEARRTLELQITDLGVEAPGKSDADVAGKLYDKKAT